MAVVNNHYKTMFYLLKKFHPEDYAQELELSKLLNESKAERRRRLYALARGLGYRFRAGQWSKEFISWDEIQEKLEEAED